jgi:hypothetical protein
MDMVRTEQATYPLRNDKRPLDDVTNTVADLLQHHGFPLIADGPDLDRLRIHLSEFLYGPAEEERSAAPHRP